MRSLVIFLLTFLLYYIPQVSGESLPEGGRPNFIVIFADDLGYQDLGCFGSKTIRTPNIDRLASEGMRLTSFYGQTVCGPSRASLMTGCYPLRVAKKNNNQVPVHPYMHSNEITIAEVLKERGYVNGCFGKWDLAGHRQKGYDDNLLPTKQGFDYFFGTPTSNDSIANLLINEEVIEQKADMANLTKRYTDEAISFIRKHQKSPFFVYIPHTMPHLRLAASDPFKGKSPRGLYGDVVEEIDFNVGRIIKEVTALNLQSRTYVIFTSDNGPWFLDKHPRLSKQVDEGGSHGGDAFPLRGHKTSTWEGGVRVPFVVWAPGRVPKGSVSDEIKTTMDLLPTLSSLAGATVPDDRSIDGQNISSLIHGVKDQLDKPSHFYYYAHTQLMAVRSGKWKLHLPRQINTMKRWDVYQKDEDLIDFSKPLLFDLKNDIGEQQNLAEDNPNKVRELTILANWARGDIGDYNQIGKNARFFDPQPKRPDIK